MQTDETLVEKVQKGDQFAFAELVNRYQNKVYGTSVRMLRNQDEALEATQEVFLKVWTRINSLSKKTNFKSWLYRIAVNHALDELRRRKSIINIPMTEGGLELIEMDFRNRPADPRQVYAHQELQEKVKGAMSCLTPQQTAVFTLRHFQGFALAEIADVLDISVGAVKATLHNAVQRMKKRLVEKKRSNSERRRFGC